MLALKNNERKNIESLKATRMAYAGISITPELRQKAKK
jgi:hypothetical protein